MTETSEEQRKRVTKLRKRRWLYAVELSLVGPPLATLTLAAGADWLDAIRSLSLWLVVSAVIVGAWLCCRHGLKGSRDETSVMSQRLSELFGLRHFFAYPPVWISGVLGAAALPLALANVAALRDALHLNADFAPPLFSVGLLSITGLPFVALMVYGAWPEEARQRRRRDEAVSLESLHASWERLKVWLLTDDAVQAPCDDAFGHLHIARRIAKRFEAPELPSQIVIGSLGSGKTSLGNLVRNELRSGFHLVPVALWPYETPSAAVEGVLRTLLHAVGREVNVVAARGLPTEYTSAMGASGGLAAVLSKLGGTPASPYDTLSKIDEIATTLNHRFVLWIEDLERFAKISGKHESTEDAHRLAPLRALLFGLSERNSISVVVATTDLRFDFDVKKIARYVEVLPLLESTDVARVLGKFREECLAYPFIDSAPTKARERLGDFTSPDAQMVRTLMGGSRDTVTDAAESLCRTPRSLKQALRRTLEAWEQLTGEIDFDDLLLMNLLREAAPRAFSLVHEHRDNLEVAFQEGADKAFAEFEMTLVNLGIEPELVPAVTTIIKWVFRPERGEEKPQGLKIRRYWERFLSEPELESQDRDQPVLRVLNSDDDEALLDLLEGPQSDHVERFKLSNARLLRLMVPLVRRRNVEDPKTWPRGTGAPPGLLSLLRMLDRRGRYDGPSAREISVQLHQCFDAGIGNLYLVERLSYWFLSATGNDGLLYVPDDKDGTALRTSAQEQLWSLLVNTYAGKPEALVHALHGAQPSVLYRIIWGALRIEQGKASGVPFANWKDLAPTVLAACPLEPTLILPQVAALITKKDGSSLHDGKTETQYRYDSEQSQALFPSEKELLRLFRDPITVDPLAQAMVDAVVAEAQKRAEEPD